MAVSTLVAERPNRSSGIESFSVDGLPFGRGSRVRLLAGALAKLGPVLDLRLLPVLSPLWRTQRAISGYRYTAALMLGQQLGVFDAFGPEGADCRELAQHCGMPVSTVEALMRIFEGMGLVKRRRTRFVPSRFLTTCLRSDGLLSLAPMLGLLGAHGAAIGAMPQSLRSGASPAPLDIFSEDSRYHAFLDAINQYLSWVSWELLARAELPPVRRFIVGSMGVSFSAALLARFPQSRVTYGCLEHLVREIPTLVEAHGVPADRIEGMHAHSGDPEEDRWGEGAYDLVFLTKKMLLAPESRTGERFAAKAFDVLHPGGVAIFWETVHPDAAPTSMAKALDAVLDLSAGPSAPGVTDQGLRRMLRNIGYRRIETIRCVTGNTTFVLARKP